MEGIRSKKMSYAYPGSRISVTVSLEAGMFEGRPSCEGEGGGNQQQEDCRPPASQVVSDSSGYGVY